MGLIIARIRLTCPKTGEKVDMIKDCMNSRGNGENCKEFNHYSIEGGLIVISCKLAVTNKSAMQKELKRLNKRRATLWLKQAKEDGVIADEEET